MTPSFKTEPLGQGYVLCVSSAHTFGTDAFLLADFCRARHKDTVADFGTGCGIIAMLLAKNAAPKQIYAVDIQPKAIEQLKAGLSLSVPCPITPICADLKTLTDIPAESLDLIVCNPPYKAPSAGILSETSADRIARHETVCTIEDICQKAARLLKFGGRLCFCQRPERLCDVLCAMRTAGIEPKRLQMVSKNSQTAPWLFLVEGKKGAKPFLQVEPAFLLYDADGAPTKELQRVSHYGEE